MNRRTILLLSSVLVVGIAVAYFMMPRASTRPDPTFAERLNAGLGSVVTAPANQSTAEQAVEAFNGWIKVRSGIVITSTSLDTLVSYSEQVAAGTRAKVSENQIKSALKAAFADVVDDLTDQDLAVLRDRLKVSPDLTQANTPPGWDPAVDIRADGRSVSLATWDANAAEFRNGTSPQAIAWRLLAASYLESEVDSRVDLYTAALAEWEGQTSFTPLQAVAVYYSIVTEDYGGGANSNMNAYMERVATQWYPSQGIYGITVGNRSAYGANGFLYRSAPDYFMSNSALSLFLTRLYQ